MTIKITGRYSEDNINTVSREFTASEATELINSNHYGMLTLSGQYEIEGIKYHASGISVGNDTVIYEKEGKLVIPTYFQKMYLSNYNSGDQSEKVKVDIIIDPTEVRNLHLTLVKGS